MIQKIVLLVSLVTLIYFVNLKSNLAILLNETHNLFDGIFPSNYAQNSIHSWFSTRSTARGSCVSLVVGPTKIQGFFLVYRKLSNTNRTFKRNH